MLARRFVAKFVTTTVCSLLVMTHCGEVLAAEPPTLEEIGTALKKWNDAWVTLRLRFTYRNTEQYRNSVKDPVEKAKVHDDTVYDVVENLWSDDLLWRRQIVSHELGKAVSGHVQVMNPRSQIQFKYMYGVKEDDAESISDLSVGRFQLLRQDPSEPSPSSFGMSAEMPLSGIRDTHTNQWLWEPFAHGEGEIVGTEDCGGVQCLHIKLRFFDFWLDPEHGYLPRRIEYIPAPDAKPGSVPGYGQKVDEFRKLDEGIWFPWKGNRWQNYGPPEEIIRWAVDEVVLNEPIDMKLFEPPEPDHGTFVIDKLTGQVFTKGFEENREHSLVADATSGTIATSGESLTATAPMSKGLFWGLTFFVMSTLCLCAGWWLNRRSRT